MWLQFTIYLFNRAELRSSGKNTVSLYCYTTGEIISLWEDEWMDIKDNFRVIHTIQTISMRSKGVICNTILTMLGKLSSDGVLGGLKGKAPVWNILLHCINMGHYYQTNKEADRQIAWQVEVNADLQKKKENMKKKKSGVWGVANRCRQKQD